MEHRPEEFWKSERSWNENTLRVSINQRERVKSDSRMDPGRQLSNLPRPQICLFWAAPAQETSPRLSSFSARHLRADEIRRVNV